MQAPRTAAALIIGNELLTGKTVDANIVLLARTLRSIGIVLDRVVIVPDEHEIIAAEVKALASSRDVLFTSGGMGPTHDDVTVEAVAEAFGVSTVVSEETERQLRDYLGDRVSEGHLRMSRIPEGARLLRTDKVPWPTVLMRNVWVLPGVPQIFAMKMRQVRLELGSGVPFVSLEVHTPLDECTLKPHLDRVVADHSSVEVGSYPLWRRRCYRTKVTFDGRQQEAVEAARDAFVALLPAKALVGPDE